MIRTRTLVYVVGLYGAALLLAAPGCVIPVQQRGTQPGYGSGGTAPDGSSGYGAPAAAPAASPETVPAAAGPVYVSIHSSCPNTVRVFIGDKPRYSSGTTTTISSNSRSSYTFQPGDMVWIVDDNDNPVSSAQIGSGTREIEISNSCTGLQTS